MIPTLTRLSLRPEPGTRSTAGFRAAAAPPAVVGARCATLHPCQTLSFCLPRAQHAERPRPDDQPSGQQQEPRVAQELAPVRRLPRVDHPAAAETAAVDRQPAGPRLRHTRDEHQQQPRRGDGRRAGREAGEQEQPEGDLQPRQHAGDDGDGRLRQHVVGADGDVRAVRVDRLEHARDEEHRREAEARDGSDDVPDLRRPHTTSLATSEPRPGRVTPPRVPTHSEYEHRTPHSKCDSATRRVTARA